MPQPEPAIPGTGPRIPIEGGSLRAPMPLPPCRYAFPDARAMPASGLVAVGGDFAPETIIAAYRKGIFPWPHPEEDLLWFSPDPRAIIPSSGLHVSRRLARTIRQGRLRVTMDTAFAAVLSGCAAHDDSWLTAGYRNGYTRLHQLGWAHSIEVWTAEGVLAGGLYGVRVGRMFGAESMFHRVTDASKVAMVALMQWAAAEGITLIDVQVINPHTERMGAVEISRAEYFRRLADALR
jgi:leucyl/phenylalanyl-tRNA--protein transferase